MWTCSELKEQGLEVELITIGNKGTQYFRSRAKLRRSFEMGQAPNPATASAIAEELLSEYLSGEVDRVEFLYTRFVNLITSEPSIRTILPLKAQGTYISQQRCRADYRFSSCWGLLLLPRFAAAWQVWRTRPTRSSA
jgi:ATP synthase F1 gamma subunit